MPDKIKENCFIWCPNERVSRVEGIIASSVGPNKNINLCLTEGCSCEELRQRLSELAGSLAVERQAEREALGLAPVVSRRSKRRMEEQEEQEKKDAQKGRRRHAPVVEEVADVPVVEDEPIIIKKRRRRA